MLALASLAGLAALAAAATVEPRAPAEPAAAIDPEPATTGVDYLAAWTEPPAGAPEDQALYRSGTDVTREVTLVRLEARRLQWRARERRYHGRLETLKQAADEPRSERAGELLARYREVLPAHYALLMRQWPVDPTRGCSYQVLHLGGVMGSAGPRKAAQLAIVRSDLEDCVARAKPAVQAMAASNRQVQAILEEAEAFLPSIAPAAPSRAPAASGARPP
jgi:hypothetical protein